MKRKYLEEKDPGSDRGTSKSLLNSFSSPIKRVPCDISKVCFNTKSLNTAEIAASTAWALGFAV